MKWWVILLIIIFAVLGAFHLSPDNVQVTPAKKNAVKSVQIYTISPQPYEQSLTINADALARESVMITAETTDKIARIHFQEGEVVRRGDVLVTLQQDSEDATLNAAEATLRDAESQFKRSAILAGKQAISTADYDTAKANLTIAEAKVKEARTMKKERIIRAPFTGVIGVRRVSEGALLEPATEIAQLDDHSVIKAELRIPERYLALISRGQKIEARSAAYPDTVFSGTISVIEARLDPASRQFKVIAEIDNQSLQLKAGMLLEISLIFAAENVLAIPEEAIIPLARKHYVFVIHDAVAHKRAVQIGRRFAGKVEIIHGVTAGDAVVTHGQFTLDDGEKVQIVTE
jgi:membrane fusion protein, multidrug efflux system